MSSWTTTEIRLLHELRDGVYGWAPRKVICQLFPRHTVSSIHSRIHSEWNRDRVEARRLRRLARESEERARLERRRDKLRRVVEMQNRVFL